MGYQCLHCSHTFSTPFGLKRHISDRHQYIADEGESSQSNLLPYEEPGLWNEDFIMEDEEDEEDEEVEEDEEYEEDEPITLEQTEPHEDARFSEISEDESKQDDITDEEFEDNLTYPLFIDAKDSSGITLDDAINDKMHPQNTEWPNDIYREFMEIVMEYQLSNSCGDRIIKLIDKSRRALNENRLPKSTKEGRKFLDVNEFRYMKFKTVPSTNFQDTIYNFNYQPIIHGIKVLLLQSDVNEEFIFKYRNKDTSFKSYGEQYESDWWNNTQKTISLDNHLLSIIIYSDSTTCDHLGKTSEHPIYISLGNIPNWMRNKSNSKVLVSYLPKLKVKDNITKNSEFFQRLQRQVFQRCLRILISPILNQNDMYFVVKNEIHAFTPKISVILADLVEAATFTATYLPSTSRRPCCFCLISNEDLNNMSLTNVIMRTPEKMREAIDLNQANELSIHADFIFFGSLRILIFTKQLFQIECICLILE